MNVRHHGNGRCVADGADGARVLFVAHGDADDLAARLKKPSDLRKRGGYVAGGRGVMDCTATGAPPPTRTPPMLTDLLIKIPRKG